MRVNRMWVNVIKLLLAVAACLCAGFVGSIFTTPSIPTWYATLQKPVFTPPNWLFAPAWTTLYVFMGIAAFLVWKKGLDADGAKRALGTFLFQLILNALWSVIFFGLRSPIGGVIIILILWIAILATMLQFFKISKAAGWLMVPYLLWVSYATALTVSIWIMNP